MSLNFESILIFRYICLISVLIYFLFEFFDRKTVKDEREELVRLKTFELMQKLTMGSLTGIALLFVWDPQMPAIFPIIVLVVASMYGEIVGKLYFRKRL